MNLAEGLSDFKGASVSKSHHAKSLSFMLVHVLIQFKSYLGYRAPTVDKKLFWQHKIHRRTEQW